MNFILLVRVQERAEVKKCRLVKRLVHKINEAKPVDTDALLRQGILELFLLDALFDRLEKHEAQVWENT